MPLEPGEDWRRGVVVDTPAPTSPPTFELAPDAVSSTPLWPVQEILDGVFFVIGTVLVLWLGWIVVTDGFDKLQDNVKIVPRKEPVAPPNS